MLKWAVGVHRAGLSGTSGAPTTTHAPTPFPAAARRARKHQRIGDKENATLSPETATQSPRRGFDALRDVSNTASPTPPNRRKRPVGASTDGPGGKRSNRRTASSDPPTPPPSSPLVDYSPCPLREAQSLLALRRRLFESSPQPTTPMTTPLLEAFDRWHATSPLPCWLPDRPFPPYGTNGRYLKGVPDGFASAFPGYHPQGGNPAKSCVSEAAATPTIHPVYGLTLPTGIPSPESPDATPSGGELTWGPASTKKTSISRRRKTSSCVSGELDLRISSSGEEGGESRLLVHVIRGTNLCRPGGDSCNAYVKVSLTSSGSGGAGAAPGNGTAGFSTSLSSASSNDEKTFQRTCVHRDSNQPVFDHRFSIEIGEGDLDKRVLISVWHRDRQLRRSDFLGCMSFPVKQAVQKEVSGSFRLLPQAVGRTQNIPASSTPPMTSSTTTTTTTTSKSSTITSTTTSSTKTTTSTGTTVIPTNCDADGFFRHLELETGSTTVPAGPGETRGAADGAATAGRTPFTTTRRLVRRGNAGFGFSVAWTQPPRIEHVTPGGAAATAGLRPGDRLIFVEKRNVVALGEEDVLQLIRSCGDQLTLEVYRRSTPNGIVPQEAPTTTSVTSSSAVNESTEKDSASTALSKRKLQLPQVAFHSEVAASAAPVSAAPSSAAAAAGGGREQGRRHAAQQLLALESAYVRSLSFGVRRFLEPLASRKDFLSPTEHQTLFQNIQELLRISEDLLDSVSSKCGGTSILAPPGTVCNVYLNHLPRLVPAYRKYLSGLQKADCLLVTKTGSATFMRLLTDPPIPRRSPDLTTLIHAPLEHFRDILRQLQILHHHCKPDDADFTTAAKLVNEVQTAYRTLTSESGLMEPEGSGDSRPLLSLSDLESRVVFTRCKVRNRIIFVPVPVEWRAQVAGQRYIVYYGAFCRWKSFPLATPGRRWIFGGDLVRVDGRSEKRFWALLFSDMLMFTQVSRDRVVFVSDEPVKLLSVTQAIFNIRKRASEFHLILDSGTPSASGIKGSPSPAVRYPRRVGRNQRSVVLRAPTPELKAVWQNLLQRQIIQINTARGCSPSGSAASTPLASPDDDAEAATLAAAIAEADDAGNSSNNRSQAAAAAVDALIEHRCRQLGRAAGTKGSAMHLAKWMRAQPPSATQTSPSPEEPREVWTAEALKRRAEQLSVTSNAARPYSRCEEFILSDDDDDEEATVAAANAAAAALPPICRQCQWTCAGGGLADDLMGPWMLMAGMSALGGAVAGDPFAPQPTPNSRQPQANGSLDTLDDSSSDAADPPYRSLSSSCDRDLQRYGTLNSLPDGLAAEDEGEVDSGDVSAGFRGADPSEMLGAAGATLRGWTSRAGCFVAAQLERLGEDIMERYLRVAPPDVTGAYAEDSATTSGEEVWGTPTSGGDSPSTKDPGECDSPPNSINAMSSITSTSAEDDIEQLMMEELLASIAPGHRLFNCRRRRLDPLPEEEDESDTSSDPPDGADAAEVTDPGRSNTGSSTSSESGESTCSVAASHYGDKGQSSGVRQGPQGPLRAPSRQAAPLQRTQEPRGFFQRLRGRRQPQQPVQSPQPSPSKKSKILWFWGRRRRDRSTTDSDASPQRRTNVSVTGTPRPGRPPTVGALLQGRSAWKQSTRTASMSSASTSSASPAAHSSASTSGLASPNLFTTRVRPA